MTVVISGVDNLTKVRLLALYSAARLECYGLRHSSGRSACQVVRKQFAIKHRDKVKVYNEFGKLLVEQGIIDRPKPL